MNYQDVFNGLSSVYPDLMPSDSASVPLDARAIAAAAEGVSFVAAKNDLCPFCDMKFAGSTRPIAVLPCGHAYHVFCGRSILQTDGKECTHEACHKDSNEVVLSRMQEAIVDAIHRGAFDVNLLHDPMTRDTAQLQILEIMRSAGMRLDNTVIDEAARTAAREVDMLARSMAAYRSKWEQGSVGKEGFSLRQRISLLAPYMNILKAGRFSTRITMKTLFTLETEKRRHDTADNSEERRKWLTGEATSDEGASLDDAMKARVSLKKMLAVDIGLSDIYFGLEVTSWGALRDLGLEKAMISGSDGSMPLVKIMDLYEVTFDTVRTELGIVAQDLHEAGLDAQYMERAGVSFPLMWLRMGLDKAMMPRFGFSPHEWQKHLHMDKKWIFTPVGFTKDDFIQFNWKPRDMELAFGLCEQEMRRLLDIPEQQAYAPSAPAFESGAVGPTGPDPGAACNPAFPRPLTGLLETLDGPRPIDAQEASAPPS